MPLPSHPWCRTPPPPTPLQPHTHLQPHPQAVKKGLPNIPSLTHTPTITLLPPSQSTSPVHISTTFFILCISTPLPPLPNPQTLFYTVFSPQRISPVFRLFSQLIPRTTIFEEIQYKTKIPPWKIVIPYFSQVASSCAPLAHEHVLSKGICCRGGVLEDTVKFSPSWEGGGGGVWGGIRWGNLRISFTTAELKHVTICTSRVWIKTCFGHEEIVFTLQTYFKQDSSV